MPSRLVCMDHVSMLLTTVHIIGGSMGKGHSRFQSGTPCRLCNLVSHTLQVSDFQVHLPDQIHPDCSRHWRKKRVSSKQGHLTSLRLTITSQLHTNLLVLQQHIHPKLNQPCSPSHSDEQSSLPQDRLLLDHHRHRQQRDSSHPLHC